MKVALSLMMLGILFSSYFIGTYVNNNYRLDVISDSGRNIVTLYDRFSCIIKVFNRYRMEVSENYDKLEANDRIMDCLKIEQDYINIKKDVGPSLSKIANMIADLDTD